MRALRLFDDDPDGLRQKPADFIATHPVFSLAEFRGNHLLRGRSPAATRALLAYHLRTGRIYLVRRGLFASVWNPDPWLLGGRLAPDAVLAYGGALSCHGIAGLGYQMAYFTACPRRDFEWNEVIYQPVRVRDPECHRPEPETVLRSGLPVQVSRVEQALVDVLHRQDLGPLLTAVAHLRHERSLSLRRLLIHARRLRRPAVNARLGYVLDGRPDMPRADLAELERGLPVRGAWFEAYRREGTLVPRWRVRVPREVRELVEGQQWLTPRELAQLTLPLSSSTPPRRSVE